MRKLIIKIASIAVCISMCLLLLTGKKYHILSMLACFAIVEIALLHTLYKELKEAVEVIKSGKEKS